MVARLSHSTSTKLGASLSTTPAVRDEVLKGADHQEFRSTHLPPGFKAVFTLIPSGSGKPSRNLLFNAHYSLFVHIKYVIDSSSLVSLIKAGLEVFLKRGGKVFFTVPEVFEEVVAEGLRRGSLDAVAARKLFDDGTIKIEGLRKSRNVDENVVELAVRTGSVVLANDTKLARKALARGAGTLSSAAFCALLFESRLISSAEFKEAVRSLVEKRRLSADNAEKFLAGVS